jgi:hypothetical protein
VAAYLGPRFFWDDLGEVLLLIRHTVSLLTPDFLSLPCQGSLGLPLPHKGGDAFCAKRRDETGDIRSKEGFP